MILVSGFNGFQQFRALEPNASQQLNEYFLKEFFLLNVPSEDVICSVSWSEILLVKGRSITICGFSNSQPGKCTSLAPPFKELITQASIGKEGYLFVCESGKVWKCSRDGVWKNISSIFHVEVLLESSTDKIVKLSCGETLTAAVSDSGLAYCFPVVFSELEGIIDVSCGKEHGILLSESGMVFTWGGGSRGQLGTGDLESSERPKEVLALSGLRVVKIAAGGWHSVALTDQGDLYTWGWNKQGQLGFPLLSDGDEHGVSVLGVPQAVDVPNPAPVEDVSCGASHTVIKLRDGSVFGCGWNKWGQLGLKGIGHCGQMTLLPVVPEVSVQKVICGAWSTLLLAS